MKAEPTVDIDFNSLAYARVIAEQFFAMTFETLLELRDVDRERINAAIGQILDAAAELDKIHAAAVRIAGSKKRIIGIGRPPFHEFGRTALARGVQDARKRKARK